jgi:hypothetical protein
MTIHTDPNAAHAVYAPSSAHRWTVCTASAEAIARLPEQEEGEEAAEGTAAHDEIERCLGALNGYPDVGGGDFVAVTDRVDADHPAAYGIALVLNFAHQLAATSDHSQFWIEQRVALTDQIWGRCDVAHWQAETGILTIVDYKNGQRAVDVEENEQLRIYAAASMFTHKLPVKWIRYVVVQPNDWRPFVPRVKQWHEPVDSLYEWAGRVAAIPRGSLKFTAGDHCRDCPLYGLCDASQDLLGQVGALVNGLVQPDQVRPEQVAAFLAQKKPIEDAFKKFEKVWQERSLKTDTPPPGMKIVATAPHRAWTNPDAAKALIVEKLGAKALDVPTPAQAIERGLPEATVHEMAPKPKGGPALAFASDKRKPFVRPTAQEMFAATAAALTNGEL